MSAVAQSWLDVQAALLQRQHRWLVTGVAGFIGSHLLERLLTLGQRVTGIDNFSTGQRASLEQVRLAVGTSAWENFRFIEGDVRTPQVCRDACVGVDLVLHQAALGSVARSIEDPLLSTEVNVMGFLQVLCAAREAGARRVVYAASSAVYGDHPDLPKVELCVGHALSPYALTKHINELYAEVFARCYQSESIGLRYFNVFGPRQDPHGPYAAVIPLWIAAMMSDQRLDIHGDGETSRDFCYVDNVVQANLLAAMTRNPAAINQVYNVAVNARTSLNRLYGLLRSLLIARFPHLHGFQPHYTEFRGGDVRHSQADISKAQALLGYVPSHRLEDGLAEALDWYVAHLAPVA